MFLFSETLSRLYVRELLIVWGLKLLLGLNFQPEHNFSRERFIHSSRVASRHTKRKYICILKEQKKKSDGTIGEN